MQLQNTVHSTHLTPKSKSRPRDKYTQPSERVPMVTGARALEQSLVTAEEQRAKVIMIPMKDYIVETRKLNQY